MYLRRHHYARINARSWFLGILFFCSSCTSYSFMTVCLSTIRIIVPLFLLLKWLLLLFLLIIHSTSKAGQIVTITSQFIGEILLKVQMNRIHHSKNGFIHINLIVLFIASGMAFNFQKHDQGRIQYLDQPYDTGIIISVLIFSLSWFCLTEIGIVFFFNRFYYALRCLRFC